MTEYHPAVRARNLINQLDEIRQAFRDQFPLRAFPMPENIESTAQQILAHEDWIPKRYEKGPSHIQMGFFSLRTIGLGGTLARVWIFFRRLVAPVFPFRKT
jgi:hypothetical protein